MRSRCVRSELLSAGTSYLKLLELNQGAKLKVVADSHPTCLALNCRYMCKQPDLNSRAALLDSSLLLHEFRARAKKALCLTKITAFITPPKK